MVKGKARAAGSFLGGLANNPAIVIIALVLGGLFIFKDRISEAFGSLGGSLGNIEINLPDLPEINLPELPKIDLPELPDFQGLFDSFQKQFEDFKFPTIPNPFVTDIPQPQKMVEDTGLIDFSKCQCGATISQDAFGNVFSECKKCASGGGDFVGGIGDPNFLAFLGLTPAQQFAAEKGGFNVPANDPFGIGGGVSFMGGTTTFGDSGDIVDTLSEVLSIFPNLTASQAADALAQNVGLTKNEFAQVDPDIINISSAGGDPDQIILNASGGFSGLTAQQIAFILTGGNISNF